MNMRDMNNTYEVVHYSAAFLGVFWRPIFNFIMVQKLLCNKQINYCTILSFIVNLVVSNYS